LENEADRAKARLRHIIEQQHGEIEQCWLERVQHDVVKSPGVELTQLRDGMPDYLIELAKALKDETKPGAGLDERGESAWSKVARNHGITRVRIGFDISQLVHEFVVLRHVIEEVAQKYEPGFGGAERPLAELLDSAIAVAVQAYVDARDYEVRRTQARNIGFLIHELRQPLSSAILASGWLRASALTEQLATLDRLDRALRRAAELIDGVLLTEKLEAGEVQPEPMEITLRQLMEPVESLKTAAEQKGLRFHATYDPDVLVRVDATLTRSAIQNVVENAVKYTDEGVVDVSVATAGDDLVVDVRDTCNGLSPEELEMIFEPFKRGRTNKTGTGLGLAIAKRAIEAQGGCIHAESPGPAGCHFSVRVPRWNWPASSRSTSPERALRSHGG
jgi:signal transduction histidine kinase